MHGERQLLIAIRGLLSFSRMHHLAGVVPHAAILVREGVEHRRHDLRQQRIVSLLKTDSGRSQAQETAFAPIGLRHRRASAG